MIIYIEEAHASDGWRFENNFDIKRHKSLDERILAAKKLRDLDPQCPIVVDKMDNRANMLYGGLYERLYIILNNVVMYAGERGPRGYKPDAVQSWLKKFLRS